MLELLISSIIFGLYFGAFLLLVLIPLAIPYGLYLGFNDKRLKAGKKYNKLGMMFKFYGRLITWRRPFLP